MRRHSTILIIVTIGALFVALYLFVPWWLAILIGLFILGIPPYVERISKNKSSRKLYILLFLLFAIFNVGNIIRTMDSETQTGRLRDDFKMANGERANLIQEVSDLRQKLKQAEDLATTAKGQVEKERLARIQLEKVSRRVRSFQIDFDIQFTSNWSGTPPKSPRVMVLGQSPVAKIHIALKTGDVRMLDLHMDREPSFGPSENGWVHTAFRVKAEPSSWIMGSDARELAEVRKLIFRPYGVNPQDSRDGNFTIGVKSRVFVNGRQAALIESKPEKEDLSQLPLQDKGFDMVLGGHWIIQLE
jgi:hypothetical protein